MTLCMHVSRLPSAFTSHTVQTHVTWCSAFVDVWEVIQQHGKMGKFKGLARAHAFKVAFNPDGEVAVWYKSWSRHKHWKPYLKNPDGDSH
jgi:hypothetical protein